MNYNKPTIREAFDAWYALQATKTSEDLLADARDRQIFKDIHVSMLQMTIRYVRVVDPTSAYYRHVFRIGGFEYNFDTLLVAIKLHGTPFALNNGQRWRRMNFDACEPATEADYLTCIKS